MSTKPVIELDFDNIKTDIINFIKNNPTFTDYNFEGSALNAIVDILSYNTHTNAYYANMLHNEGFIETAQKRSSVVSRAKELGYIPKSVTGSKAIVSINLYDAENVITHVPRGATFSSSNENGSYTFVAINDARYDVVGNNKTFSNINLTEGVLTSNTFTVNTNTNLKSIFNIPNKNIDISTLKVYVKQNSSSVDRVEYNANSNLFDNLSTSTVFFIQESYDGYFQIYFGNDIMGKQPVNGNVIVAEYVIPRVRSEADGCNNFYSASFYPNLSLVTTIQPSYGGTDKETAESIKFNAVQSYPTKHRAITENDYVSILKENFSFIKSVSVWGGETNVPPQYGKVFISIQPINGYTLTNTVKHDTILPLVKSYSALSLTPEFVDPSYTDLEFITDVKFNKNRSTLTVEAINSLIKTTIASYVNDISVYNTDYLHSQMLNRIIDLDSGIMSTTISKKIGFTITPNINVLTQHIRKLNTEIVPYSTYSNKFYVYINSTQLEVSIKEIPDSLVVATSYNQTTAKTTRLALYDTTTGKLVRTIGSLNLLNGEFIFAFSLYAYRTINRVIQIRCNSVSEDLIPMRNQIYTMRPNIEDAVTGIISNNIVNTTIYAK